jgi:dopamine receptor D1
MINTSGHQNDDVLYNANDEVYHPIIQNNFLMVIKFICCLIGIPLNVSIAVTIIRRRNLRTKPRNIFLLGIILSYLSFFIPPAIELIYWGPYPIDSVCQSYVAVVALPHGLLLSNMLLALADRYMAINHPLFHREKITVRFASVSILSSIHSSGRILTLTYFSGPGLLTRRNYLRA